jgi:hypothetical protein
MRQQMRHFLILVSSKIALDRVLAHAKSVTDLT